MFWSSTVEEKITFEHSSIIQLFLLLSVLELKSIYESSFKNE